MPRLAPVTRAVGCSMVTSIGESRRKDHNEVLVPSGGSTARMPMKAAPARSLLVYLPRCVTMNCRTCNLFENCLRQSFVIAAADSFEGMPFVLARIDMATSWAKSHIVHLGDRGGKMTKCVRAVLFEIG